MEITPLSLVLILCFGVCRSSEILQRQKRSWIIDSFIINESFTGPFPHSLGTIQVSKNLTLFQIEGQGVDDEPKGILKINEYTGEITLHGPVDHEKFKVLRLKFKALDKYSRVVDTRLGIEINIIDSNDNAPEFDNENYQVTIEESSMQGSSLITIKATDKDSSDKYNKFDLRIVSVNPKPQDLEFYLTQQPGSQTGVISFKGCLGHEKAEKYTFIVEAKDHGEFKQLSSSCTVIINVKDGNNHLPVFKQPIGPGKVKEGLENVLVKRLQVTDEDTKGTEAWRAKYKTQGDTNSNFRITTDPDTNDGLLYVQKHLDYEDGHMKNVTITVENEIPYYSCKVKSRNTVGLWNVIYIGGTISDEKGTDRASGLSTYHVTVMVEDVNEPPIFDKPNKKVHVKENIKAGQWLEKFTARDPDVASANTFVYIKGDDPANWVTVNANTGDVTLSKTTDRESHFVKDNIYVVTIYAVDNGQPPMTSTATLSIYVIDDNDNAPSLTESTIDMCQSHGPSWANITAVDLDEEPYSGPFNFKLLGNVKGKWKIDPEQGYSVNLVKENTVHSGYHELLLEVSDLQGNTAVHNLTVTVCSCSDTARPNCRFRKSTTSATGGAALGIILLGILLLAGMLIMAFHVDKVSCKNKIMILPENSGQHLMKCNTEELGTDCKVATDQLSQGYGDIKQTQAIMSTPPTVTTFVDHGVSGYGLFQTEMQSRNYLRQVATDQLSQGYGHNKQNQILSQAMMKPPPSVTLSIDHGMSGYGLSHTEMQSRSYLQQSIGASSTTTMRYKCRNSVSENWMSHSKYSHKEHLIQNDLLSQLNKMLFMLQDPRVELGDYAPHVYAEEGDMESNSELDAISIPDIPFNPDFAQDLDYRFNTLALICTPSESAAFSEKNPVTTTPTRKP